MVVLDTRRRSRRPRLVLVAACALLIAGVVAATVVNRQYQYQALSFTERGDKLIVRVVDPNADPSSTTPSSRRWPEHQGEDVAVSPPFVGTMFTFSARDSEDMDQLHRLEAAEKCSGTLNASGPRCQEGLESPKDDDGETEIQFGRATKLGDMFWHSSPSATGKGESLAGMKLRNKTVAEALPLIAAKGVKVVAYYDSRNAPSSTTSANPPTAGTYRTHPRSPRARSCSGPARRRRSSSRMPLPRGRRSRRERRVGAEAQRQATVSHRSLKPSTPNGASSRADPLDPKATRWSRSSMANRARSDGHTRLTA
ncbi:hypothetical protein ACQPXM_11435 [Kribbella sp. CA-253562]|uniref:hypothetical protein n=1 Tax=Kribbella sp. CA-253562 TaxID=3239942 RepID=UPI003D926A2D